MNEALKYLQGAHGVLHGNLCPRSVFVTREWIWKLGGFAFAERLASESVLSPLLPSSRTPTRIRILLVRSRHMYHCAT